MNSSAAYRKYCLTVQQAAKESNILQFLRTSPLGKIAPELIEPRQGLVVEMSHIVGRAPTPADLTTPFLQQLGEILSQLHRLIPNGSFGSLNCELKPTQPFPTFGSFLNAQLNKWVSWHESNGTCDLRPYISWLYRQLDTHRIYFDNVAPDFCQGDLDLKNIIVAGT